MKNRKEAIEKLQGLNKAELMDKLVVAYLGLDRIAEIGGDSVFNDEDEFDYAFRMGLYGFFPDEAFTIECLQYNECNLEYMVEEIKEGNHSYTDDQVKNILEADKTIKLNY